MNLVKKTTILLILFFLTITFIPLRSESNGLDVFYFNNNLTLEEIEVSIYSSEKTLITTLEKEDYIINETEWFHFYLLDFTFEVDLEYILIIDILNSSLELEYTITDEHSIYYINKYAISNILDDLVNKVTYATFIDRKQLKFFTKYPISSLEMNLLKNDVYISKDNYVFNDVKGQYFLNLDDDINFDFEYFIELTTLDGLTSGLNFINYHEIYTTGFFETLFNYNGNDLGVNYLENLTTFKVWAPTLNNLTLELYSPDGIKTDLTMEKNNDGVFYYKSYGNLINYEYTYRFKRNNVIHQVVDPYVKYVSSNRGLITDLNSFTPQDFKTFKPITYFTNPADYVIYESSIDKLTGSLQQKELRGLFNGLIDNNLTYLSANDGAFTVGLQHLKDLGVTHLTLSELLKTNFSLSVINNSYASNGAIGTDHYELKQLIKTLNDNGINIVFELNTYNEVINSLEKLVPGYYYETSLGKVITNNNKAFFETDHYMTNKYIDSQLTYLINTFKLQGIKINPLNNLKINYLNNELKEITKDEGFLFYGEFNEFIPKNSSNKLSTPSSLDKARHVGFIDEQRFLYDESYLNSTYNNGLKGYILSSWNQTYNTLSPAQSFKRLNYFYSLPNSVNRQIKALQLLSYGVTVITGGEEIGFYSNLPINYGFKNANNDLFKFYQELIAFKKEHPSLKVFNHSDLKDDVIYKAKDNVISYHIISSLDLYPHLLIVHNLGDEATFTLPNGLDGYEHYNRDGELNWSIAFDSLKYYTKEQTFENKSEIILQKNQSLILHFGLNKENIIEDPIKTPTGPKETNLIFYLLISGGLIVLAGIVITYFILNSTKDENL